MDTAPIQAQSPKHARALVLSLIQADVSQTWKVNVHDIDEYNSPAYTEDRDLGKTIDHRNTAIPESDVFDSESTAAASPTPRREQSVGRRRSLFRRRSTKKQRRSSFFSTSRSESILSFVIEIESPVRAKEDSNGEIEVWSDSYSASVPMTDFKRLCKQYSRGRSRAKGFNELSSFHLEDIRLYFETNLHLESFREHWLYERIPHRIKHNLFQGDGQLPKGSSVKLTHV
eukprot:TRINITY_DN12594_c0_g1_i7.p1 TRINITY_DN12594_c0_g1~~TRINITY_DN12594_c0_g1_i7.p1  ORF type:complete len:229 (+),score=52.53 TRINITY_DN12594_c0_g1_i7:124-810(+)